MLVFAECSIRILEKFGYFCLLHSGRDLPQPGSVLWCGEGVAVVLYLELAGESLLVVKSKIMSVCMQFGDNDPSDSQQCVSIISAHAPTHRVQAEVKEK